MQRGSAGFGRLGGVQPHHVLTLDVIWGVPRTNPGRDPGRGALAGGKMACSGVRLVSDARVECNLTGRTLEGTLVLSVGTPFSGGAQVTLKPEPRKPEPQTRNPKPPSPKVESRKPKAERSPEIRTPKPRAPNPELKTRKLAPLNPKPCTPERETRNPKA